MFYNIPWNIETNINKLLLETRQVLPFFKCRKQRFCFTIIKITNHYGFFQLFEKFLLTFLWSTKYWRHYLTDASLRSDVVAANFVSLLSNSSCSRNNFLFKACISLSANWYAFSFSSSLKFGFIKNRSGLEGYLIQFRLSQIRRLIQFQLSQIRRQTLSIQSVKSVWDKSEVFHEFGGCCKLGSYTSFIIQDLLIWPIAIKVISNMPNQVINF